MAVSLPVNVCFSAKTKEEQEKDELIYKNYDKLISTLPKSSQTHFQLSLFRGFWFPNGANFGLKSLQGTMATREHFISRPGDILLATLPKVGTTWLKSLAFATLNRSNNLYPQSNLLSHNPHECVPLLEYQLYSDNRLPNLDVLPSPRLLATHIPYSVLPPSVVESECCKIVYLCRNPRDTCISMWKFANNITNKHEPLQEFLNAFLSGVYISGPFWDNVLEYWKASLEMPKKVLFLKYEDLKREPYVQLKSLAEFMGCGFTKEEEDEGVVENILKMCCFESLKGLEVNQTSRTLVWSVDIDNKAFFRKGEVGDWVNHLSSEMVEQFDKVMKEKFDGTGLSFDIN